MSDAVTIAALAGLAGLLALDATAAFQVMVSQPIVAGALAGAVCGDAFAGVLVGAALQLVWLGALPVGAAGFPDAPVGTVVGVGLASLLAHSGTGAGWSVAFGMTAALVAAEAGRSVVSRLRRMNVRLAEGAVARARSGDPSGVSAAVWLGLASRFVAAAGLAAVALTVAYVGLRALPLGEVRGGFPALIWAAPIAAAVVAVRSRQALERALIAAGFLAGLLFVIGR
ncbi:MAG: PTS sugar transporter subunit IIC [Candidatus Eisenbacteria bacterium]